MLPNMPERIGTPENDNLRASNNEIVYGGPGNDHLTLGAWNHAYLVGGSGNDSYTLGPGSFAVILDSSGHDTINTPFHVSTAGAVTADGGRHLIVVDLNSGTLIMVVDSHKNPIETFNLGGFVTTQQGLEAAISANGWHLGDVTYKQMGDLYGFDADFLAAGLEAEINSIFAREDALFATAPSVSPQPVPPKPVPTPEAPLAPAPAPSTPDSSIAAPSYFDAQWYLHQNSDVAAAGMDPFLHFTTFGWNEGRDPNPYFDSDWYLTHNPDVAAAGMNPVEHYWNFGWQEGRDPGSEFSTDAYLELHTDVALAGMNPLEHYLEWGIGEGREIGV